MARDAFPTPHDWKEGRRLRAWALAQQGRQQPCPRARPIPVGATVLKVTWGRLRGGRAAAVGAHGAGAGASKRPAPRCSTRTLTIKHCRANSDSSMKPMA